MTDRSVEKSSHQNLALLLFGIQDTFPTQKRKMFVFAVAYREVRKVSPSKPVVAASSWFTHLELKFPFIL